MPDMTRPTMLMLGCTFALLPATASAAKPDNRVTVKQGTTSVALKPGGGCFPGSACMMSGAPENLPTVRLRPGRASFRTLIRGDRVPTSVNVYFQAKGSGKERTWKVTRTGKRSFRFTVPRGAPSSGTLRIGVYGPMRPRGLDWDISFYGRFVRC